MEEAPVKRILPKNHVYFCLFSLHFLFHLDLVRIIAHRLYLLRPRIFHKSYRFQSNIYTNRIRAEGVVLHPNGDDFYIVERDAYCRRISKGSMADPQSTKLIVRSDFRSPKSIAIDNQGNLLISDIQAFGIHVLSDGNYDFFKTISNTNPNIPSTIGPLGVTINPCNQEIVVLSNSGVLVFDRERTYLRTIQFTEMQKKKIANEDENEVCNLNLQPKAIAVDSKGKILVVDDLDVKIFSEDGLLIKTIALQANFIVVDDNDNFAVTEDQARRVGIYNQDGELLTQFGHSIDTEMTNPSGIHLTQDGDLIVASGGTRKRTQLWVGVK